MSEIKIRKRISLEFLGEEYKSSYLVFIAVGLKEIDALQSAAQKAQDKDKSLDYIQEVLADKFVEGKISQDGADIEVSKDNLFDLPADVIYRIFEDITGTSTDPKA